ncbi:MAG: glycosyltransferase [Isosphaeraceae bacterium]
MSEVGWFCPALGPTDGYGNASENMILALDRAGYAVGGFSIPWILCRGTSDRAQELLNRHFITAPRRVVILSPPPFWREYPNLSKLTFGFSMYEADRLPESWIPALDSVDEIFVPATWNVELFAAHTKRPITVVPLGINTASYTPTKRVRGDKLRFCHSATASSEIRKGREVAEAAFKSAFQGRDDVELILRSSHIYDYETNDHRIKKSFGSISTEEQSALYKSCDALLFPSRGEGFGFVPLEFMATGGAAIFPNSTGMADYAHLGLSVRSKIVQARIGEGRPGFGDGNIAKGNWYEPNFSDLVERLQYIDKHYDEAMDQAAMSAEIIRDTWNWDATINKMSVRFFQ